MKPALKTTISNRKNETNVPFHLTLRHVQHSRQLHNAFTTCLRRLESGAEAGCGDADAEAASVARV
jgi:hypothetical protein